MFVFDTDAKPQPCQADLDQSSRREPVRSLFVSWTLTNGGSERVVSTVLHHLDRRKIKPSLCLLQGAASYPIPNDVEVAKLGHQGAWSYLRTIWRLSRYLNSAKPDIVFSNIGSANIVVGEALRLCRQRPRWIARVGSHPAQEFSGWQRILFHGWQRRVYRWADTVVVNSHLLSRDIRQYFPTTAGRVVTLLNPADFDEIDRLADAPPQLVAPSGKPLILTVARLHPAKRLDLLLRAFSLVKKNVDAELWICGEGELRAQVERDIERLSLNDSVRLLGFCENPYSLMKQASVFVLTSDREGLPNSLIEAQGLGLPAVSTRCPSGPEEIIEDHRTGILTPTGDAQSIAAAILSVLANRSTRDTMSREARRTARRKFGVNERMHEFEKLLTEQREGQCSSSGIGYTQTS